MRADPTEALCNIGDRWKRTWRGGGGGERYRQTQRDRDRTERQTQRDRDTQKDRHRETDIDKGREVVYRAGNMLGSAIIIIKLW